MSGETGRSHRRGVILFLISLLCALGLAELAVRMLGYSPWKPNSAVRLTLESSSPFFRQDPITGFAIQTPRATISVNELSFSVQHDSVQLADSTFMLHRSATPSPASRAADVWLLGGSYTYGWGVGDKEHYPALLGDSLGARVYNFAVPGYGTLHSLLQLNKLLQATEIRPSLVLFGHAPFHAERNVSTRRWRKMLSAYNALGDISLPFVDTGDIDQLQYESLRYSPVPLSGISALANATDDAINRITYDHKLATEVMVNLLVEMSRVCKENGIDFAVVNLVSDASSPELLSLLSDRDILFVDATVDLRIKEYTLMPDDSHPSPVAHAQYAGLARDSVTSWLGR